MKEYVYYMPEIDQILISSKKVKKGKWVEVVYLDFALLYILKYVYLGEL
jgi:hypothetical protein